MIKEFGAFLNLFRQGKELSNSATWKNRTNMANALTGILSSAVVIAGGFGYEIPVAEEQLQQVGLGLAAVVCLVNIVVHVITSKKVGLPARPDPIGDFPKLHP